MSAAVGCPAHAGPVSAVSATRLAANADVLHRMCTLDRKEEKEIARKMMTMVMSINGDALKGLGDASVPEKVTCYTCYAGAVFC